MGFMVPEIYNKTRYWVIENENGESFVHVPFRGEEIGTYLEGLKNYAPEAFDTRPSIARVDEHKGTVWRLSAPGYMDCTDWCSAADEDEAIEQIVDRYSIDCDGDDIDWELPCNRSRTITDIFWCSKNKSEVEDAA